MQLVQTALDIGNRFVAAHLPAQFSHQMFASALRFAEQLPSRPVQVLWRVQAFMAFAQSNIPPAQQLQYAMFALNEAEGAAPLPLSEVCSPTSSTVDSTS